MREIPLVLKFSGPTKASRAMKKKLGLHRSKGWLAGYCEGRKSPPEFKVWINSRMTDREIVDSFFHEMTHMLINIRFTKKPFRLSKKNEEMLCRWVGYMAKQQFSDMAPDIFGRIKR